jgi:hypothetical protein
LEVSVRKWPLRGVPILAGTLGLAVTPAVHAAVSAPSQAAAAARCTDVFTGARSISWVNPANWSTHRVPGPGDWVCISKSSLHADIPPKYGETITGITSAGFISLSGKLAITSAKPGSTIASIALTNQHPSFSSEPDTKLSTRARLSVGDLALSSATIGGPGGVRVVRGGKLTIGMATVAHGSSLINDGSATEPGWLTVDGGSFTNNGKLTVGKNVVLNVAPGGTYTNNGTLTVEMGAILLATRGVASQVKSGAVVPAVPGGSLVNTGKIVVDSSAADPATLGGDYMGIENRGLIDVAKGAWVTTAGNTLTRDVRDTGVVLTRPFTIAPGGRFVVEDGATVFDGAGGMFVRDEDNGGVFAVAGGGSVKVVTGGRFAITTQSHLTAAADGSVNIEGLLYIESGEPSSVGHLTIGGAGKLVINGNSAVGASSVSVAEHGTIELDPKAVGLQGELVSTGPAVISGASLFLNYDAGAGISPACGATVTVLTAQAVTGSFGSLSVTPPPAKGTWQLQTAPTTAGAVLSCS